MDQSYYREQPARCSPAGSVISSQGQGTKRRRTTYNTPIPIEYRNQFLRTPDSAFSPSASQNGKPEAPLFGSSTNRTLFGVPPRNASSPTAGVHIPSRQNPTGQLQTSPPRASGPQRSIRRPGRLGIPTGRSNVSSIGPSRGTSVAGSVAGSVDGNSARPHSSLGMLGSSIARPPGSTRSSVDSGSLRGSVSHYTASSYSRPLPSAEELKKRADPLIGFLGKSIQRAKGALYESKEAEKEAQRIKEREDIRRSQEEEERRRRDAIFQQVMEEEAERERLEILEEARALQRKRREEAAANKIHTATPAESQAMPPMEVEEATQTEKVESRHHAPSVPSTEPHRAIEEQTTKPEVSYDLGPSSPPTIRHEPQPSKFAIESDHSDAEEVVINEKEAREAVSSYGKYQFSDDEFLEEGDEEDSTAFIPVKKYEPTREELSDDDDHNEISEEEDENAAAEGYESGDYEENHGEVAYEGFNDEEEGLEYSEDEEEEEEDTRTNPQKMDNSVIEIIDDDSEEEFSEDDTEKRAGSHIQQTGNKSMNQREEGDDEEEEEDYDESEDEDAGGYDEREDEDDEYFTEEVEETMEQVEVEGPKVGGEHTIEEESMDIYDSEDDHEPPAVDIVDLDADEDMVEVVGSNDIRQVDEPASEHVDAYEDMDICLDFSDTDQPVMELQDRLDSNKRLDDIRREEAEAATHLEALAHEDDFSKMDDWEKELLGGSPQKFPIGNHVWRRIEQDDGTEDVLTEKESEAEDEDDKSAAANSVPPSFLDLMGHKYGPYNEKFGQDSGPAEHPSFHTPNERLRIIDDDADDEGSQKAHDEKQNRMEVHTDNSKPTYEREGTEVYEDEIPVVSQPEVCNSTDESGSTLVNNLSGTIADSEDKTIDDILEEKEDAFNQEMRASDLGGNLEPFIQEGEQIAFVFNRDVSPPLNRTDEVNIAEAPENTQTEENLDGQTAPIILNKEAPPALELRDTTLSDPIATLNKEPTLATDSHEEKQGEPADLDLESSPPPKRTKTSTFMDSLRGHPLDKAFYAVETSQAVMDEASDEPPSTEKVEEAHQQITPKKESTPIPNAHIEIRDEPTVALKKEDSPIRQTMEDAKDTRTIILNKEASPVEASHEEMPPTTEDSAMEDPVDISKSPARGNQGESVEIGGISSEDARLPESSGETLGAEMTSRIEENAPMSEVEQVVSPADVDNNIQEPVQFSSMPEKSEAGLGEEASPTNENEATAGEASEDQNEAKGNTTNSDFVSGTIHTNIHSETTVHFSSMEMEYRTVIDEDVPTTVLTIKEFDAEVIETTEATELQLPPAPEVSTPDPRPFEVEEKEEDPESEDVTWKAPDSPMTGTTEIYIRETETKDDEQSTLDVEILQEDGAPGSEEDADGNADGGSDEDEDAMEEDDAGSVYQEEEGSADDDESDRDYPDTTSKRIAQQLSTEEEVHKPSSETVREKDQDLLSINVKLANAESSDSKSNSPAHDKTAEMVTPTRSTFAVVIESPTNPAQRRASLASYTAEEEEESIAPVEADEALSPTIKKRKREAGEAEDTSQKATKVTSDSTPRSRSPAAEEEEIKTGAEDETLEQHQHDLVNDIVSGEDELPASTSEGMELRDGKIVASAEAASEQNGDQNADVVDGEERENNEGEAAMEPQAEKAIPIEEETTKEEEHTESENEEEEARDQIVLEASSPSKGMELRDGKVIAATPSRETSAEPREAVGRSSRRGKPLNTPKKRGTSATPSLSPPVPTGVSTGEDILPKGQQSKRKPKAKAPVPSTPVRRSTRRASPLPPSTSQQILSPLPEAEEAEEKTLEEIVVKSSAKSKRTSKKRSVQEVATDEATSPTVKETRGGKRARTISRGPSVEPEEGGLKSRLRRKA